MGATLLEAGRWASTNAGAPRLTSLHRPLMLAIALGLAASLTWGTADFVGGLQARRLPVVAVVLGSQISGLILVATVAGIRQEGLPTAHHFLLFAALSSL